MTLDKWIEDGVKDGTPRDDGDASQTGHPFGDNSSQDITPRVLRNFAFEIDAAIAAASTALPKTAAVVPNLQIFGGNLYLTVMDPAPVIKPDTKFVTDPTTGWKDLGPVGGSTGTATAGAKGDKGDVGPIGPAGADGAIGPAGAVSTTPGPAGADSTVPGPAGAGPAGPVGPAGSDGTDGDKGDLGNPGYDGTDGSPGTPGTPGARWFVDTTNPPSPGLTDSHGPPRPGDFILILPAGDVLEVTAWS